METLEVVLIPIIAILSAVALPVFACGYILISLIRSRSKERLELIKQGIVPSSQPKPASNKYIALRNGFICMGLSLGIILGIVLNYFLNFDSITSILLMSSTILLGLGSAYLIFFIGTKNKNLDE